MSSKSVMCLLIVISLGLAGCSSDKNPPQNAQKPKVTKQTDGTTSSKTPAPSAATPAAPADQKATAGSTTGTTTGTAAQPPAATEVPKPSPAAEPAPVSKRPDVIFVATPPEVVDKMLELAQPTKDDVVYDLGCGDGRIVVAAAKLGCKAYGFDVDPQRIKESKENVEKAGVGSLATIEQKDIFTLDLSKANVITLYLLPSLNVKLIPQLEKLKPGCRIVSHDFDMEGVTPDKVVQVTSASGYEHTVYLWTTPLKKETQQQE
jgi:precorrin-6B methylase 2